MKKINERKLRGGICWCIGSFILVLVSLRILNCFPLWDCYYFFVFIFIFFFMSVRLVRDRDRQEQTDTKDEKQREDRAGAGTGWGWDGLGLGPRAGARSGKVEMGGSDTAWRCVWFSSSSADIKVR